MNNDSSSKREETERGVRPSRPRSHRKKILQRLVFRHSVPVLQSYGCRLRAVNWALVWCSLQLKCARGPRFPPAESDCCRAAVRQILMIIILYNNCVTSCSPPAAQRLKPILQTATAVWQQNKTKRLLCTEARQKWMKSTRHQYISFFYIFLECGLFHIWCLCLFFRTGSAPTPCQMLKYMSLHMSYFSSQNQGGSFKTWSASDYSL